MRVAKGRGFDFLLLLFFFGIIFCIIGVSTHTGLVVSLQWWDGLGLHKLCGKGHRLIFAEFRCGQGQGAICWLTGCLCLRMSWGVSAGEICLETGRWLLLTKVTFVCIQVTKLALEPAFEYPYISLSHKARVIKVKCWMEIFCLSNMPLESNYASSKEPGNEQVW